MRQSYRIIPIYTADVSGVCSALYELGGMTVMHDPSGCNSTYNTHDEIRWYEQDSMIYISGLTEIDAVMGNDEKMICDIELAAEELKPKFIALAGSPIPYMNGTDFRQSLGCWNKILESRHFRFRQMECMIMYMVPVWLLQRLQNVSKERKK